MNTYVTSQLLGIFMGAVFIVISLICGVAGWSKSISAKTQWSFRFQIPIFLSCGVIMILVYTCGPNPKERFEKDQKIIRLTAETVHRLVVLPESESSRYNLVHQETVIEEREQLTSICEALKTAKTTAPNHPSASWDAIVRIEGEGIDFEFSVSSTKTQGVILWLNEPYRCDDLGKRLEDVLAEKEP